MKCKNCGNIISEIFCSYCGQRTTISAINFKTLIVELQNNIFQIDRGLLFTIKELTTRPGNAIRDFIEGKRKPYYKPIPFLIINVTLYVFVSYLLNVDSFLAEFINSFKRGWDSAQLDNDELIKGDNGVLNWLKTNQIYLVFVFLPVFSLASFVAFLRGKYNYYEHLVLQLYITGQQFVFVTILTCFFFFNKEILAISILISSIFYSIFTYNQFFEKKSLIVIISRYILLQLIFIILYFIISFVIIFTGIFIAKLI